MMITLKKMMIMMTLTTMIMMMIDGNRGQEFDKVKNNEDQSVC